MSAPLVIAVAGGFGRELAAYARDAGFEVAAFLHDLEAHPHSLDGIALGAKVRGPAETYRPGEEEVLAIGLGEPAARRELAETLCGRGARLATVVHPTAWVAPTATLGAGVVIAPFAFVGPGAHIDDLTVLNTYASVGHDGHVGRACVLSPYAVTGGWATLEDEVFLATHAVVTPRKRVGAGSSVSAGSVVFRDVAPRSLAAGNPARARALYATPEVSAA
jgi:sugar O-acyltransferase (sialic acid O-acetyltransferase NeuD family)